MPAVPIHSREQAIAHRALQQLRASTSRTACRRPVERVGVKCMCCRCCCHPCCCHLPRPAPHRHRQHHWTQDQVSDDGRRQAVQAGHQPWVRWVGGQSRAGGPGAAGYRGACACRAGSVAGERLRYPRTVHQWCRCLNYLVQFVGTLVGEVGSHPTTFPRHVSIPGR